MIRQTIRTAIVALVTVLFALLPANLILADDGGHRMFSNNLDLPSLEQNNSRATSGRPRLANNFFGGSSTSAASRSTSNTEQIYGAPPAVLSLIVSGESQAHVAIQLDRLLKLKKQRHVKIGEVLITGTTGFLSQAGPNGNLPQGRAAANTTMSHSDVGTAAVGPIYKHLEQIGLPQFRAFEAHKVISRLKIKYSPTWVVRHLGRDYVFEGFEDPSSLFNRRGEFIRE